jgi:hypothetical protein
MPIGLLICCCHLASLISLALQLSLAAAFIRSGSFLLLPSLPFLPCFLLLANDFRRWFSLLSRLFCSLRLLLWLVLAIHPSSSGLNWINSWCCDFSTILLLVSGEHGTGLFQFYVYSIKSKL